MLLANIQGIFEANCGPDSSESDRHHIHARCFWFKSVIQENWLPMHQTCVSDMCFVSQLSTIKFLVTNYLGPGRAIGPGGNINIEQTTSAELLETGCVQVEVLNYGNSLSAITRRQGVTVSTVQLGSSSVD